MAVKLKPELQTGVAAASAGPANPIRARALLIGAIAAAATAVLVTQAEIVLSTVRVGFLQLPPAALAMLIIALGFSQLIKRYSLKAGLSSGDLLVIYCMSLVSAMVSSHGVVQKLIPLLVIPNYYATNENNWHELYDPNIPHSLVPYNPAIGGSQAVVQNYYNGLPRGASIPWGAWLQPVVAWGLLIGLVLFAFLCLTAILRKQWVDNEKLSFPLAQLPMDIVGGEGQVSLFQNSWMWLGAAVPISIFGLKLLHQLLPTIPDITLTWTLGDYITTLPWKPAVDGIPVMLSFAAIGFFFLLPTDMLLSIWFFFVVSRLEIAAGTAYNIDMPSMPQFPPPLFEGYQTMGAYMVLVLYFAYIARPHLKNVFQAAIGKATVDDSQELMPYRVAFWGLIGSILAAAAWLVWAGMSPWLALLELVVGILVVGVVMARSTAEAGLLMTETTFRPINIYQMFAPMHSLGSANLTLLVFMDSLFLRDQRGLLLCGFMDSAKIADGSKLPRRSFGLVLGLGVFVALVVAIGLNIALPYHIGALKMDSWIEQGNSRWTFTDTSAMLSATGGSGSEPWQMPTFFGVGVAVTLFLTFMRSLFFWWPLHPLGYALAGSWGTVQFWFPCLIAWIIKSICLRYGGMKSYVRIRPVFLGMVVGEFVMAVLSVILNMLFHISVPAFPWD